MFDRLSTGLTKIIDNIKHRGKITQSRFDGAVGEIKSCLLEADVALEVAESFISSVKEKAIGQEIFKSVSPADMITKIINDELVETLSDKTGSKDLNLRGQVASILLLGLQGSGKTTSSAKLARRLKEAGKTPLLVSLDIYRPSARQQLEIMARSAGVDSLEIIENEKVKQILKRAKTASKTGKYDVVLYDSAGRTNIDAEMLDELKMIEREVNPSEGILVLDAMTGQDAINIAKGFDQTVNVTSLIISRVDGDSRGGVALSAKFITGKPIKFLGVGEKAADLEEFDAQRIADRILDKGDVVSLVKQAEKLASEDGAKRTAERMQQGKFNFNDYISQIKQVGRLGGLGSIVSMLPGANKIKQKMDAAGVDDKILKKQEAIISSMTPSERKNPGLTNLSRRQRIAKGSGVRLREVDELYKQHQKMYKMIKKAKNMDISSLMGGIMK